MVGLFGFRSIDFSIVRNLYLISYIRHIIFFEIVYYIVT